MKHIRKKYCMLPVFFLLTVLLLSGCAKPFIVPGAQNKILIWQEDTGLYRVYFSAKNSAARASQGHVAAGMLSSDGVFEVKGFNTDKKDSIIAGEGIIDFQIQLDTENYYKGLDIKVSDYSFVEFDIKYDGNYRRDLLSLGNNLNYPEQDVFRVDKDYLLEMQEVPFYQKRPVSSLVSGLSDDRVFLFFYLLLMLGLIAGIIVFSILIDRSKKK